MSAQIHHAMSHMWVYGLEAAFTPNLPGTVSAKKKEAYHLVTARLPAIQHEHTARLSITMSHHLVTMSVKWPRLPLPDAQLLQNPDGFIALLDLVPKRSQTWKMHALVRAQGSASTEVWMRLHVSANLNPKSLNISNLSISNPQIVIHISTHIIPVKKACVHFIWTSCKKHCHQGADDRDWSSRCRLHASSKSKRR